MIKCGADTLVREKLRHWYCTHADKNVRATRASGDAVRRKEIAE